MRQTILDCVGALNDAAEEARSSGRRASSGESVIDMLEKNVVTGW